MKSTSNLKKDKIIISSLIMAVVSLLLFSMTISAADALYRFMHNDHDALVIGQVAKVSGKTISVKVAKSIISAKDLNINAPKKQVTLKTASITLTSGYSLYYDKGVSLLSPKAGDYVLVSLKKKKSSFSVAWGLYKINKTDYKTLNVLYPKNAPQYVKMEAAAVKAFVNSGGKLTEFAFDGDTGRVTSEGKLIIEVGSK